MKKKKKSNPPCQYHFPSLFKHTICFLVSFNGHESRRISINLTYKYREKKKEKLYRKTRTIKIGYIQNTVLPPTHYLSYLSNNNNNKKKPKKKSLRDWQ